MDKKSQKSNGVYQEAIDADYWIIMSVYKTASLIYDKSLTESQLRKKIIKGITSLKIPEDAMAILSEHLSKLYFQLRFTDLSKTEIDLTSTRNPFYEIYMEGKCKIVRDIKKYLKKRERYLFWIDITKREALSYGKIQKYPQPTARELLKFLTNYIGASISVEDAYKYLIDDKIIELNECKKAIHVYLSQLQKISEEDFIKLYLNANWKEGIIGLRESFRGKYFIFTTWGSQGGSTIAAITEPA